jgi:DNA (cytosine-5)-methyltransferase 1
VGDLISGGVPCQDLSVIGTGLGLQGKRSGLWADYARTIELIKPKFVFIENVPALLKRGFNKVLADLSSLGFDARWCCLSAAALGGEHHRNRLWILAFPKGLSRNETNKSNMPRREWPAWKEPIGSNRKSKTEPDWFLSEAFFDRRIDETPNRKQRVTAIGNSQDPTVAATAFRILSEGLLEGTN